MTARRRHRPNSGRGTLANSFNAERTLEVNGKTYTYFGLPEAGEGGLGDISQLPVSLKILLENLLRFEDGRTVTADDVKAVAEWIKDRRSDREIAYSPARVLMQDLTGVPAVVDLAAMRQAMVDLGGDPKHINPLSPVDLVIDHSVMVDVYARPDAAAANVVREYERNQERYSFLRWGQSTFDNFRVVPPGAGICHQVNLEYLSKVVWTNSENVAYPDTLVGT
ncbi:MAG TPA: aconitase family protein, partial [Alphaproteobacteria bacterium]|nr:aconitase family protein [Alphaproteobacteria bacterium]